MASESSESRTVSVELPAEINDWLETQAAEVGVDRDALLVQLVAAYRTTVDADEPVEIEGAVLSEDEIATAVDEQLDQRIESTVRETADELVTDRVNEARSGVQRQLGDRIDTVGDDLQSKIEDVRERVIQVKREADSKASDDHTHDELNDIAALEDQIEALEAELVELRTGFEEGNERVDGLDDRLGEVEERLQTVAWVVSDLREAHESGNGLEAVERIKRAAAKADIERAKCENCGEKTTLSLLTDPECPHCRTTVTNVEADPGWFRSPKLRTASKLESGESE